LEENLEGNSEKCKGEFRKLEIENKGQQDKHRSTLGVSGSTGVVNAEVVSEKYSVDDSWGEFKMKSRREKRVSLQGDDVQEMDKWRSFWSDVSFA
jgi:hypothetical protein